MKKIDENQTIKQFIEEHGTEPCKFVLKDDKTYIDTAFADKLLERWKGGEVYKTMVHKATGDYTVLAGKNGLTSSKTPMLLPQNSTMKAMGEWMDANGFEVVLKNYVLKNVLVKVNK